MTGKDGSAGAGGSTTQLLTLTINPAPTAPSITSASTANATVGIGFTYTTTTSVAATGFAATGLPSPLVINAGTGAITGTPSAAGTYTIGITATNAVGTGPTGLLVLTISPSPNAPIITSSPAVSATAGTVLPTYTVTGSGSPTSFAITSGTLPTGLSLNGSTGDITGTPSGAGTTTVWIAGTNGSGQGPSLGILFTIAPAPVTPAITSNPTASGQVGQPFSYTISASNSPTSFAATGLPAGLGLDPLGGVISGITTVATTTAISVTLTASKAGGAAWALSAATTVPLPAPS